MNTFRRFRLQIPRTFLEEIVAKGINELPNECCGLLAGIISDDSLTAKVTHHYPLTNALKSPVLFESDPKEMLFTFRDIRQKGIEILAVYHSHPTSAPIPSKTDLARNFSEQAICLIISLKADEPEIRAWWLTETNMQEGIFDVIECI